MNKLFDGLIVYLLVVSLRGINSKWFQKQEVKIGGRVCSSNEKYLECGSDCGHICPDIGRKDLMCNASQCTRGCFCESGFYRDFRQSGRCVGPKECQTFHNQSSKALPLKCPANQEYKCGSDCGRTCDDIHIKVKCRESCQLGCYCVDGYYRESKIGGKCVKEKYCKKKIQKKLNSKKREFVQWFKKHFPWKN